jgi:hypothetical protein
MMVAVQSAGLVGQDASKTAPVQPLPYSHKQHIALGLKCQTCHIEPDPGEMMTYPATEICMSCHETVDKDKAPIQKLAEYAKSHQDIPWVRIYRIPDWVDFSHKNHLEAGATCDRCHGAVAQRDVLFKEGDLSMGACMECHREKGAPVQCDYCHDPR